MEVKDVLKQVNSYIEKKEFDKAMKFLESSGVEAPEIFNMKGIIYMNLDDPKTAEKMYSKAINMAKKKGNVPHFFYSNRAFAMLRLGRQKDALNDVEKAISISPNEVKLYDLLSNIYVSMNMFKEALNILDKASAIFPGHPMIIKKKKEVVDLSKIVIDPYKSLIDAASKYMKDKEPRIALDILDRTKNYKQTDEVYGMMARCYWEIEDYEKGYKVIDNAIKLCDDKKKKAEYLWVKAKFSNALNKKKEAIKLCRQALKLDDKPQYYYDLSFYLMIERKNNDALKQINKAIKVQPYNPHNYIRKGDILSHLHKMDKAIEMYDKAIELDPLLKSAYERKQNAINAKKFEVGEHKKRSKDMFA